MAVLFTCNEFTFNFETLEGYPGNTPVLPSSGKLFLTFSVITGNLPLVSTCEIKCNGYYVKSVESTTVSNSFTSGISYFLMTSRGH